MKATVDRELTPRDRARLALALLAPAMAEADAAGLQAATDYTICVATSVEVGAPDEICAEHLHALKAAHVQWHRLLTAQHALEAWLQQAEAR